MDKIGIIFIPGASGGADESRFQPFYNLIENKFKVIPLDIWKSKEHLDKLTFEEIFEVITNTISGSSCEKIILVGKSFGGGVCIKYDHPKVIGRILWAPAFTYSDKENFNLDKTVKSYEMATKITFNDFNLEIPTFIIHGTEDQVIPHTNSEKILNNSNDKLTTIKGADHSFKNKKHCKELYNKSVKFIELISNLQYINTIVTIDVDRPLGTKHPKWNFEYPINYGYVPNTKSGDGEELDAYILGINKPVSQFKGRCIAIIHRTEDSDDKLIVVPEGTSFSDEDIIKKVKFQEKWFKSIIIR